jgi:hypothetical protein
LRILLHIALICMEHGGTSLVGYKLADLYEYEFTLLQGQQRYQPNFRPQALTVGIGRAIRQPVGKIPASCWSVGIEEKPKECATRPAGDAQIALSV